MPPTLRRQTVATSELLSTLPVSTKHINTLVTLTRVSQASPMSRPLFRGARCLSRQARHQGVTRRHGQSGDACETRGEGHQRIEYASWLTGSVESSSLVATVCLRTLVASTSGADPLTVDGLFNEPTFMSAFTVAVNSRGQLDSLPLDGAEAGQAEGQGVGAGPQIDNRVAALVVP